MRAALLALLLCSGCIVSGVRKSSLLPAIQLAWPGVRADVEAGGAFTSDLVRWDMAVDNGEFAGLDVALLRDEAVAGVDARLAAGEVGAVGAGIMIQRAVNFHDAVEEYLRPPRRIADNGRPTVITSGSWADNPPPAIAEEVFR